MPLAMREPHHLVFERRAVSWPNSCDLPVVERGIADVPAHELVDAIGGVKQVTRRDVLRRFGGHERERNRRVIAVFHVEHTALDAFVKVDRLSSEPRRRSGLQSAPAEAQFLDGFGQIARWRLAGAARGPLFTPNVNQTVEERAGRDDERLAAETAPILELQGRKSGRFLAKSARRGR